MRQKIYKIIYNVLEKDGHSDNEFHKILREENIRKENKSQIKRISFGTIERCIELDYYLGKVSKLAVAKMDAAVRTILRMAAYEIFYMDNIPDSATVNEAVELVRSKKGEKYTSFVNGILRNIIRKKDAPLFNIKENYIKYSIPKDLYQELIGFYGKKTAARIGESFLEREGYTTLQYNAEKISIDEFEKNLNIQGLDYEKKGNSFIVKNCPDLTTLDGYDRGEFFAQDISATLPVLCSGIGPGDLVVDVCAAPGGKSMQAWMKMKKKGKLYSRDISEKKVKLLKENFKRMNFLDIIVEKRDARQLDEKLKGKVDFVIADVPCSALGVAGRKPEIKYHAYENSNNIIEIQRDICKAAKEMLKPGGILIYSTCTINQKENSDQVEWMEKNLGLSPESLDDFLPDDMKNKQTKSGMLQVIPGISQGDGFFVARLIKKNQ